MSWDMVLVLNRVGLQKSNEKIRLSSQYWKQSEEYYTEIKPTSETHSGANYFIEF